MKSVDQKRLITHCLQRAAMLMSVVDCKGLIIYNVVLLTIKHSNSELDNN